MESSIPASSAFPAPPNSAHQSHPLAGAAANSSSSSAIPLHPASSRRGDARTRVTGAVCSAATVADTAVAAADTAATAAATAAAAAVAAPAAAASSLSPSPLRLRGSSNCWCEVAQANGNGSRILPAALRPSTVGEGAAPAAAAAERAAVAARAAAGMKAKATTKAAATVAPRAAAAPDTAAAERAAAVKAAAIARATAAARAALGARAARAAVGGGSGKREEGEEGSQLCLRVGLAGGREGGARFIKPATADEKAAVTASSYVAWDLEAAVVRGAAGKRGAGDEDEGDVRRRRAAAAAPDERGVNGMRRWGCEEEVEAAATAAAEVEAAAVAAETELEHFAAVKDAFELYEQDALLEVTRIERHLRCLFPEDAALLEETVDDRVRQLKLAIARNQAFINLMLVATDNENMYPEPQRAVAAAASPFLERADGGGSNGRAAAAGTPVEEEEKRRQQQAKGCCGGGGESGGGRRQRRRRSGGGCGGARDNRNEEDGEAAEGGKAHRGDKGAVRYQERTWDLEGRSVEEGDGEEGGGREKADADEEAAQWSFQRQLQHQLVQRRRELWRWQQQRQHWQQQQQHEGVLQEEKQQQQPLQESGRNGTKRSNRRKRERRKARRTAAAFEQQKNDAEHPTGEVFFSSASVSSSCPPSSSSSSSSSSSFSSSKAAVRGEAAAGGNYAADLRNGDSHISSCIPTGSMSHSCCSSGNTNNCSSNNCKNKERRENTYNSSSNKSNVQGSTKNTIDTSCTNTKERGSEGTSHSSSSNSINDEGSRGKRISSSINGCSMDGCSIIGGSSSSDVRRNRSSSSAGRRSESSYEGRDSRGGEAGKQHEGKCSSSTGNKAWATPGEGKAPAEKTGEAEETERRIGESTVAKEEEKAAAKEGGQRKEQRGGRGPLPEGKSGEESSRRQVETQPPAEGSSRKENNRLCYSQEEQLLHTLWEKLQQQRQRHQQLKEEEKEQQQQQQQQQRKSQQQQKPQQQQQKPQQRKRKALQRKMKLQRDVVGTVDGDKRRERTALWKSKAGKGGGAWRKQAKWLWAEGARGCYSSSSRSRSSSRSCEWNNWAGRWEEEYEGDGREARRQDPSPNACLLASQEERKELLLARVAGVDHEKLARNMAKVRSTLRQFVRDWAEEGKEERDAAYAPLLQALELHCPIVDRSFPPRVLCPGSGLGRLPFEVTRRGYACQGNEFSYFMLIGSDFILNHAIAPKSCALQPYCLSTSNRRGKYDHLQTIYIPDISPNEQLLENTDFSMCAGEFVEVYGAAKDSWQPPSPSGSRRGFNAVLTSYFLDTARNVLQYIRTIAKLLPPGGLWANIGPLLYHYAEMPHEMSIELSWEELQQVIRLWFDIKTVEWRDSYYTSNPLSMMQVQYHCVFFVAIRNSAPAPRVRPPY